MTSLQSLPIEVLEWITSVIGAESQAILLQCGNRTLNTKLANGGVKTSHFTWKRPTWMEWPAVMIRTFHGMEEFSLASRSCNGICHGMDLYLLPRTLKSLRISSDDIFCFVLRHDIRFGDLFPVLDELNLTGIRLTKELFRHLPVSLRSLSLADFGRELPDSDFLELLPSGLKELYLWFNFVDNSPALKFPDTLEKLHVSTVVCDFDYFDKIPGNLVSLTISAEPAQYQAPVEFDWTKLPRGLTELTVDYPTHLPAHALRLLPSSLTSLEAWIEGGLRDSMMTDLPRNLVTFQSLQGNITHEGLLQCPPTLQHLTVDVSASTPELLSFYPRKITTAKIIHGPFAHEIRGPLSLPNLHSLEVAFITDEICQLLPQNMHYLEFTSGTLSEKGAAAIPKTLHSIYAGITAFQSDAVLSHLGWVNCMVWRVNSDSDVDLQLTELCLEHVNVTGKGWRTFTLLLNNRYAAAKLLTHNFIASLSRLPTLKNFTLEASKTRFSPVYFGLLPPTIRDLSIDKLSHCPSAEHLEKLPRQIQKLEFVWPRKLACTWRNEDLQYLPRTLNALRISGKSRHLTKQGMEKYLPPYLCEFRARWTPVRTFMDPITKEYGPDPTAPVEDDFSYEDTFNSGTGDTTTESIPDEGGSSLADRRPTD